MESEPSNGVTNPPEESSDLLSPNKKNSEDIITEGTWYTGSGSDDDDDDSSENNTNPITVLCDGPIPTIAFSKAEIKSLRAPWRKVLIVKLLGRRVCYKVLNQIMEPSWILKSKFQVLAWHRDYYVIRFLCKEDFEHVLLDGPWFFHGNLISLPLRGSVRVRRCG
ncbi:hypothetical protein Acr_03g0009050 [Actinidia rufa]|uniref:DUF4283 domain-containing protein n=1 Tax=Actinidia rufa TaxID=165716 RepID=A0A7J0ECD1_9ERIC|nr:hypothetical protein Acr_03g0009050 [Actinidia rufa]